jgi:methylated-DNA-[protein]-cysteine S-methyltransferase
MNNLIDEKIFSHWLGDTKDVVPDHPLLQTIDQIFTVVPGLETVRNAQSKLKHALIANHENVVFYDSISHPLLGKIYAAATEKGLFALDFDLSEGEFINRIELDSARIANRSSAKIKPILEQVHKYLDGNRYNFDLSLDLSGISEFHRQVLLVTFQVPHGQVVTYADIARKIGKPRAARAVGQALRRNPIPIVIPCHRIIASDGSLRGYKGSSGLNIKAALLKLEGCQLPG